MNHKKYELFNNINIKNYNHSFILKRNPFKYTTIEISNIHMRLSLREIEKTNQKKKKKNQQKEKETSDH